jgi:hypothetical protein
MDKVFVYRNLHKNMWSLRCTKTRRVKGYCDDLVLQGATFKVSEAGRQRVLREHTKNVHAGVEGILKPSSFLTEEIKSEMIRVSYNPYLYDSFVDINGNPVYNALFVMLCSTGKAYMLKG